MKTEGKGCLAIIGAIIGVLASLVTIIIFISGKQSLPEIIKDVPASSPAARPAAFPIQIRVQDSLSYGQVRDEISVTIGGITKTLVADSSNPFTLAAFNLPESGTYDYDLRVTTTFNTHSLPQIKFCQHTGTAKGSVTVSNGSVLTVQGQYNFQNDAYQVGLR